MLGSYEQEALVSRIAGATSEAVSLDDLGDEVLPLLERTFATSTSLLYGCREGNVIDTVAGGMVADGREYLDEHYPSDPMQTFMRQHNPWIFHGTRCPEWNYYRKLPVHQFLVRTGVADYVHLRLSDTGHHAPGTVAIVLARSRRQPDFSESDHMLLARVLPSLTAVARRHKRIAEEIRGRAVVEAVAAADPSPRLALDARGALQWASPRAAELLHLDRQPLPPQLAAVARRLTSGAPAPATLAIHGKEGTSIRAELRLTHTRGGVALVVVALEEPGVPPRLVELARRVELTQTEAEVLALLARGLSDRQIARRRFVSPATVHTHVSRVLAKLGVSSRVQAALLARGFSPDCDEDVTPGR